jgi:hypothetical protein
MLGHFRIFIQAIEQDLITLSIFYHEFLNVLAVFRTSSNEYANAFADNFDGRFHAMADGTLAQLSYIFRVEGFAGFSGLNPGRPAETDAPVESLLDTAEYALAKLDVVKKLQGVTPILCHFEVHGRLMKVFDHYTQSKGTGPRTVLEC